MSSIFLSSTELMQTPEATTANLIDIGFHALSEPLRIKVLELLRQQELCVCDLCNALGVSQSKLSFHLKTLKEAGLVRARQEGRWIYYSLNVSQFTVLEEYLAQFSRLTKITPACPCCE
jgi:ArsR family transcriptional regulator, arsenate/arsenite/antimonite-responsive transcriptional repressor